MSHRTLNVSLQYLVNFWHCFNSVTGGLFFFCATLGVHSFVFQRASSWYGAHICAVILKGLGILMGCILSSQRNEVPYWVLQDSVVATTSLQKSALPSLHQRFGKVLVHCHYYGRPME